MKTTTFRQAPVVNFYSYQEWKWTEHWGRDLALGVYDPDANVIEVLWDLAGLKADVEDCPNVYRYIPDNYWKAVLVHEYTHFLQWKKGKGVEPLPLLQEGSIPVRNLVRQVYEPEEWIIEAEAMWVEKRPWLLDGLEESLKEPVPQLSEEEQALIDQGLQGEFLGPWQLLSDDGDMWYWCPLDRKWVDQWEWRRFDDYE